MDGIFLIDKPIGITSRNVCNQIGKKFHTKKVGHLGTLDPFASGVLIVAINKATKALTFLDESVKEYIATIKLGIETDSLDNTGRVIKEITPKKYSEEDIKNVLTKFKGGLKQVPPMTSAIHVNGKRLYELAHQGIEVERTARDITVYENKLISYNKETEEITVYFKVSSGTYIRTLGSDIAKELGSIGHLNKLERVGVNVFSIDECVSLEDVLSDKVSPKEVKEILSKVMDVISFNDEKVNDIKNGKIRFLDIKSNSNKILVVDSSNHEVAVYSKNKDNRFEFARGLF